MCDTAKSVTHRYFQFTFFDLCKRKKATKLKTKHSASFFQKAGYFCVKLLTFTAILLVKLLAFSLFDLLKVRKCGKANK